jgi:hypothetical protein
MKRFLVFVMILCMAFLLCAGAQEPIKVEPVPAPKPVTNLTVKLIDDMNDKVVELNNCIVQVVGELHICEDSFNYSNSFTEGDRYDITIWVKLKK